MSKRVLHTIRLAGPWEFQVADASDDWQTIKLPADWRTILQRLRADESQTRIEARRRFQRPTGLDGGERVWLVIPASDEAGITLRINDAADPLPTHEHPLGVACEVTGSLQQSNVVALAFDIDRLIADDADSSFAGAVVEIRAADAE